MAQPELVVRPRGIALLCGISIAVIVALHTTSQVARFAFGHDYQLGLAARLYVGAEASVANWFSTVLLVACATALLAIAATTRGRDARCWFGLGVVFLILSLDEAAALHDLVSPLFNGVFGRLAASIGGPFTALARKPNYGWEIPGAAFAAIVGLIYLRFVMRLPIETRRLFFLSATIYVGAAVGIDFIEGWYSGLHGPKNPTFVALVTAEETLEMVGASVFLYALLAYAEASVGAIRISFSPTADTRARSAAAERRSPSS